MEQTPTSLPTQDQTQAPIQKPTKTDKKNQSLIISLIVCAILAIAGIAFGIFGLITSNHKSSEIDGLKSLITEKDKTIANLKNPETPSTPTEIPTETPTTNSYALFADNLSKNSTSIFGTYYHYTGSDNIQRTMLAKVENGHLKITDLDDGDKLITEADDVLTVYFIHIGNGGTPYFYIIHKDGKVSRICIAENVDRTLENLDYSNIISVYEGSDLFAYLIDVNGNVHKTN